ncbi:MAG: hypothetical protein IIA03_09610 [Proteobacteria bacterium]|jgi:hypothetical protein|uniref:DUF6970 domain-containing protein n=1 Tax=Acidovorax soli TaxID=592050 RepID=UPI002F38AA1B|nr:hypothetical protein [Methylibium sp.]MBY0365085.1 hypothetical protein [Burkholderiaceae bacterium]MCH8856477.1 hypothetical protein [Pseudomonadota bacterium]|mmetsp:Transcript_122260/g.341011  ORF Transcript_122260/g.341011 Transcript_122260/m.341011 type:complete len:130 (+) Transcript_122260:2061-2450(+)
MAGFLTPLRQALPALLLATGGLTASAQHAPPAQPDPTAPTSLQQALREGRVPKNAFVLRAPDGRPAYLLTAPCCDHFNPLYDADGRYVCAPTGGFPGNGDGGCPDWVWEALQPRKSPPPDPAPSSTATR